ncbi:hypothetical protein O6H91_Y081600 [Diphasiastrum complanatum]|nr:hypothetical protein O6H91_Y081600 [Diphasiastrum complanatum]
MAVFCGFLASAAARPTGIGFVLSSQFQAAAQNDTPKLAPVVLVPGTGGNQVYARLTNAYKPGSVLCWSWGDSSFFRLWLSVLQIVPPFTQCFAERMKLEYNADTKRFQNAEGVETKVPYFGSTESMEYLDPALKSVSGYFANLVSGLKSKGYIVGKTLYGAPYDFRYAPGPYAADVAIKYAENLKNLIETASGSNEDRSVVVLAHSLGVLWVHYVIHQQPIEWRQKYISRFITVSGPWGGSVQALLTMASGNAEGVPLIDPLTLRAEQRSSETNLWLLPVMEVFNSSVLVTTPSRNYTAYDYEDLFHDIGYPEGFGYYKSRIPLLTSSLTAPLIPVTVIFGQGVKTAETLNYKCCGFDHQPDIGYGDGDGTVPLLSLQAISSKWAAVEGQITREIRLLNKSHLTLVTDPDAVEVIVGEVLKECSGVLPL